MSCPRSVSARRHRPGRRVAGRRPRVLLGLLLVLGAVLAALPGAGLALAQDTLPKLTDQLTDDYDALTGPEETQVRQALDALRSTDNVQLFVLYTDSTGIEEAPDFAARTAEANSMGGNDALLVVAFDDRSYALWVADGLNEVTDAEIDDILSNTLEPRLVDGDYAGAAIASAQALGEAATTGTAPEPTGGGALPPGPTVGPGATATPGETTGGGGGIDLMPIVAIVVIAGGVLLVVRTLIARRSAAKADEEERDRLSREANRALLSVDELVRDAEQELGFAEAQWGEAEAKPFREAMGRASAELKAAFGVRQKLDDEVPDTPEQRRAMLAEIVERTGRAKSELEGQLKRLAQLRDLERTAPDQLKAIPAAVEALRQRRAAAGTLLDRLQQRYAPSAVASVQGNLVEADKCLASAEAEAQRGSAAVEARRQDAVVALRRAQESQACATRLIDAIERLGARLDEAAAQAMPELTEAEADVAKARAAVATPATVGAGAAAGSGPAAGGMGEAVAQAERLLGEARRAVQVVPMDPLVALERATAAHRAADAVLSQMEAAEQARQRQVQLVGRSITAARGRVERAVDYITTRRHGVGERARTRAAEAEASLRQAEQLATTDPDGAVQAANRAQQLADEAYSLAASEFEGWDSGGGPVAGPYRRDPFQSPEAQVVGAVLGGILGGVLSGGMRGGRGSGWGGSPWGGVGGRGGGGFGLPSGPRGGGWGGGGIRMGGGGGGRARGGRW